MSEEKPDLSDLLTVDGTKQEIKRVTEQSRAELKHLRAWLKVLQDREGK